MPPRGISGQTFQTDCYLSQFTTRFNLALLEDLVDLGNQKLVMQWAFVLRSYMRSQSNSELAIIATLKWRNEVLLCIYNRSIYKCKCKIAQQMYLYEGEEFKVKEVLWLYKNGTMFSCSKQTLFDHDRQMKMFCQ